MYCYLYDSLLCNSPIDVVLFSYNAGDEFDYTHNVLLLLVRDSHNQDNIIFN